MGKKKRFLGISIVIIAAMAYSYRHEFFDVNIQPTFIGNSTELKQTNIVPTLDSTIEEAKNTIWCASFVAAWKSIERDITKEPVALEGNPEIATQLNNAQAPSKYIPPSNLYAIAGWNNKGIQDQIRTDLAQKFPRKQPPEFPRLDVDSLLAYAYLEVNLPFTYKFERNPKPLQFTDSKSGKSTVTSFGLPDSMYIDHRLEAQPKVLYHELNENQELIEFAIDLDQYSKDDQIVVASTTPDLTLRESVQKVQKHILEAEANETWYSSPTVLLVPDTVWQITHRFTKLEGNKFSNQSIKGRPIRYATQDTQFRLDHEGAVLKSESMMADTASSTISEFPGHYILDKPFLLYMKKRNAKHPYFVMWVANAELLNPWTE